MVLEEDKGEAGRAVMSRRGLIVCGTAEAFYPHPFPSCLPRLGVTPRDCPVAPSGFRARLLLCTPFMQHVLSPSNFRIASR